MRYEDTSTFVTILNTKYVITNNCNLNM